MKRLLFTLLTLSLLVTSAFSSTALNNGSLEAPAPRGPVIPALDEQCVIDFQEFTYGSHSGRTFWVGGDHTVRLTGHCFTTSGCGLLPDTFYTYCTDVNHELERDPYCAEIYEVVVRDAYPLQYPAMAYLLTWYDATSNLTDRIKQLSIWKVSNDQSGGATDGVPFYHIDDGRGYPTIGDTPVFPYVNTLYNNDDANNDPANDRVLDALGYDNTLSPTGIAKNIVIVGDQFLIATDPVVIDGGTATVCVTVTLERGTHAVDDLNNDSVSGVRVFFEDLSGNGTLDVSEAFTDANGQATVCIERPVNDSYEAVEFRVCSWGVWPLEIMPCEGEDPSQSLIAQDLTSGSVDTVCATLEIPGDTWLAVELVSFTATSNNGDLVLNWSTASETGNDYFKILRDGTHYGSVDGSNSPSGASYSWTDRYVETGREYAYDLIAVDVNGTAELIGSINTSISTTSATVTEYALHQNYPNPFNPQTNILFDLAEAGNVTLTVINPLGQTVATLVQGNLKAGRHSITFEAGDLPSGLYFYQLTAGDFHATRKLVLMK